MIPNPNSNLRPPVLVMPLWVSRKAVALYFAALLVVGVLYSKYILDWYWLLAGIISVCAFFFGSEALSRKWSIARIRSDRSFSKKLFWTAFSIRLLWVFLIYTINIFVYDDSFGFEAGDALFYDELGGYVSNMLRNGRFNFYSELNARCGGRLDISDTGYAVYLGVVYFLTGNSILVARIIKAALSAYTAVLIYRMAGRNFDEQVGRLAGIFCMLMPNFWYYCGCQLKETEMVFLAVLFAEQADQMLRSRQFTMWKLAPLMLIVLALFTIRTPLALVCVLALLFTIVMASGRVMNWGKRILIGLLAVGLIGTMMGDRIEREASALMEKVQSGEQQKNMAWRAERRDMAGNQNKFAKYAGASVFTPLIFTIPFPTIVNTPKQEVQKLMHGGNLIKNVLSGFVIFAMFALLFSGEWRRYLLPLSLMLGYLMVLVLSTFAHSERFHQPALPFELMFAAYGISLVIRGVPLKIGFGSRSIYKRWFMIWIIVMFVACVAWSWFKLKGRGL